MSVTMQILTFKEEAESAEVFVQKEGILTTELCRHVEIILFQFHLGNTGKCSVFLSIRVHVKL